MSDVAFGAQKLNTAGNHGDYTQQGVLRPSDYVPTKPGIYYPQMAYGGNIPGTSNQLDTRWNPSTYQGMAGVYPEPDPYSRTGRTLPEAEPSEANVNAEKQEQVLGNFTQDGLPALMNVDGPPHTEGGKDISVPDNSFIYSDTKALKIKNPELLKLFNETKAKTPAQIAKKYDLQKFTKVIADPDSDKVSKDTAQLMVQNYTNKLSKLAEIQEGMKAPVQPGTQSPMMPQYQGGGPGPKKGVDHGSDYAPWDSRVGQAQGYPSTFPQNTSDYQKWANMRGAGLNVDNKLGINTLGWENPDRPIQPLTTSGYHGIETPDIQIPDVPQVNNIQDNYNPSPVQNNLGTALSAPPAIRPAFTSPSPDKWGVLNSMYNLATIHKYPAWEAPVGAVAPNVVFEDPIRALAANQEASNAAGYNGS